MAKKSKQNEPEGSIKNDVAIKVTSPLSWCVLMLATALVVITIIWSVTGKLPMTISAPGMLVSSTTGTAAVYADIPGYVTEVYFGPDNTNLIYIGDPVMKLRTDSGEEYIIYSDQVGYVTEIKNPADKIEKPGEVLRVSPYVSSELSVAAYVRPDEAKKIERGDAVEVVLEGADSQRNGHMIGRIINVDAYAAETGRVLRADAAQRDNAAVSVVAVTIELMPDSESVNGYKWSGSSGSEIKVDTGMNCRVRIVTDEKVPMAKLFEKLVEKYEESHAKK